jgi:hypothetical protein
MRTANVRLLGFIIALVVVAGNVAGVEEKKGEKKKKLPAIAANVVKVEIEDEEGAFTTSENEKKITELLAFFPELGRVSCDAGGWGPTYCIKCLRKNGECFVIDIFFSSKLNCWSDGMGDWPLKDPDGLKKLMDSFFRNKEKKKAEKKEAMAGVRNGPRKKVADIIADIVKLEIQRAPNRKKERMQEQSVALEDKKKIVKLLAFFSEIGEKSDHKGLWVADYHIKCTLKKDDPIYIRVSWDLKRWSDGPEGLGDWRLKDPEKFEKLIDDWIKKK